MNTDRNLTLLDPLTTTAAAEGPSWWRRQLADAARATTNAVDGGGRWWRRNWPLLAAGLAALTVVAIVLRLLWMLLSAIGAGIGNAGDGVHRFAGWVARGPITHSINDPVRTWLDAHSSGLPATGRDLWITWLATAAVLYTAAVAGSRYARIGWAVIGALTAAAAYAGAGPAGLGAAGVTVTVWLLLSLLAYARTGGSVIEQIIRDMGRRRDAQLRIAELQAEADARAEARAARQARRDETDPDHDIDHDIDFGPEPGPAGPIFL